MSAKAPLVSIIIRTHNRPSLLTRALESAYSQTYINLEIIVVNDYGSNIDPIILHFQTLPQSPEIGRSVHCVRTKRRLGRAGAANTGLSASHGKYIGFLDDDDYFFADHVKIHVTELEKRKKNVSFSMVSESIESIGPNGALDQLARHFHELKDFHKLELLFFDNVFPINSFVFRRDVLDKIGPFDVKREVLEDWDFIIRLFLNYDPILIPQVTAEYSTRINGDGVRAGAQGAAVWQKNFREVRRKYSEVFHDQKINVPISEVDSFLSKLAVESYQMKRENDEMRDSLAFKVFRSPHYGWLKKIRRWLRP